MTNPALVRQTTAGDPWVNLNQAVEIRGRTRAPLLLEVIDGKIRYQKVGGRWFFHREDLQRLADESPVSDGETEE